MSKRDEFFDILNSIQMDSITGFSKSESLLKPIPEWLKENTPTRLFRFFSTNDRNISALKHNEIWGSISTTFNDPYECLPSFDINRINEDFKKALNADMLKQFFDAIRQGLRIPQMQTIPDELLKILIAKISSDSFDKTLKESFESFRSFMEYWGNNMIPQAICDFYTLFQSQQKYEYITCFSENLFSTLLWAHYSESHKGFCLEYNWKDSIYKNDITNKTVLLAPVKYSATRFDASSYIYTLLESKATKQMKIDAKPYFRDMLAFMKILLVKSLDWSYEQEWRLFAYDVDTTEKHKVICKQQPTAIYIGAKSSPELEQELYQISLEKNIQCYKMMQSFIDNRFVVEPKLYTEYKNSIFLAQHFNTEYGTVN